MLHATRYTNIIDISLPIDEATIIYPGNPRVSIKTIRGATSTHSEITFGSHTGTHVDAPRHVFEQGKGVDSISLEALIGECRVFDMTHVKEAIAIRDFQKYNVTKGERILVKTKNSLRGFETFYDDYIYLDGDAADWLGEKEIMLFGIDYLSVKKKGGEDSRPHTSLLKAGIVIFEGLDLSKVQAGTYTFIGLPLKLTNLDGAPARAILIM